MSQDERKGRGGRSPGPKNGGGRVDAAFDRWLSRQLNQMYGDVLNEPIPQSMLDLLTEAERRSSEAGGEGGPQGGASGDAGPDRFSPDDAGSSGPLPGSRRQSIPQEQQMQAQAASGDAEDPVADDESSDCGPKD